MTITVNSLGDNSAAISYSAGSTQAEIASSLRTTLSSLGWEVFDEISEAETVFRAINKSGVGYKFARVAVETSLVVLQSYEDWDAEASQGNNLAYVPNNNFHQKCDLTNGGSLFVFASARWLALLSRVGSDDWGCSQDKTFTGIFEVAKDNPEEVAGDYPLGFWTTGAMLVGSEGYSSNQGRCGALPRTGAGQEGANAWYYSSIATLVGRSTGSNAYAMYQHIPNGTNPMSPTSAGQIFTPYYVESTDWVRGRLYGIKVLPRNVGSIMDKINVRVNSDMFFDAAGSATHLHHVLTAYVSNYQPRFAIPE